MLCERVVYLCSRRETDGLIRVMLELSGRALRRCF